ncbi:MAG: hypothetical protein AAF293_12335 [Pseudomonadota bacterium]
MSVVDDDSSCTKVAVKKLLPKIVAWQQEKGYPLKLSAEATLKLADDPELLDLMFRANFREVFTGIENPRPASLTETQTNCTTCGATRRRTIWRASLMRALWCRSGLSSVSTKTTPTLLPSS